MNKPKYFYETEKPHEWSGGPIRFTYTDADEPIASLEEAKALAEAAQTGRWGEKGYVRARYGVMYEVEEEAKVG